MPTMICFSRPHVGCNSFAARKRFAHARETSKKVVVSAEKLSEGSNEFGRKSKPFDCTTVFFAMLLLLLLFLNLRSGDELLADFEEFGLLFSKGDDDAVLN